MSLRLRLLIGILVLAAAGLLTLDFVSYRALENHLSDRVDDQVQSAALALAPELRKKAGIEDAGFGFPDGSGFGGPQQSVTGASGGQPPFGDFGPGGGPTGNPGGGLPNELPPGTFAQLKSASGKVLATAFFGYGTASVTRPDLGGDIPVGRFGEAPEIVTVGAQGGSGTEFRASAVADQAGRITYVAVPTSDMKETLDQLLLIEAIVTAAVLIALAGLAWWMIGIGLRPLERMSETAGEIAAGDLSRRVEDEDPRTETGRLGISLNKMLHQIEDSVRQREESEARMRQFLADASHELRTPSPRSAATRSSIASARYRKARRQTGRSRGSKTNRPGWETWSTGSSPSPGSANCRNRCAARSISPWSPPSAPLMRRRCHRTGSSASIPPRT